VDFDVKFLGDGKRLGEEVGVVEKSRVSNAKEESGRIAFEVNCYNFVVVFAHS
jgi:hypothetical protein